MSLYVPKKNRVTIIESFSDICFIFFIITEFAFVHSKINIISLIAFGLSTIFLMVEKKKIHGNYYFLLYVLFIIYNFFNISENKAIDSIVASAMLRTLVLNLILYFFMFNYVVLRNNLFVTIRQFINVTMLLTVIIVAISLPTLFKDRLGNAIGINANEIAIYAAISFLMVLFNYLKLNTRKDLRKLMWFGIVVLFTGSRKGLLMMAIGYVIILYLLYPRKKFKHTVSIMLMVVICYLLIMNVPTLYNIIGNRVQAGFSMFSSNEIEEGSLVSRISYINLGWDYIKDNPWRGYGLDCFALIDGSYGVYSHNNFIEILFSSGIIGFVIYYINYIIIIIKGFHMKVEEKSYTKLFTTITLILIFAEYGMVTYFDRATIIFTIYTIAAIKIGKIRLKIERR
ncbi:O-antigen ligase family protein [Clostridium sp.]|uniref:O-antigen ligase family protein n=1 Tax=Clostridium sp. TaxID=1506 RepID=UPI003D6D5F6F